MGCSCVDPSKQKNSEYTIVDAQWMKDISKYHAILMNEIYFLKLFQHKKY